MWKVLEYGRGSRKVLAATSNEKVNEANTSGAFSPGLAEKT